MKTEKKLFEILKKFGKKIFFKINYCISLLIVSLSLNKL